GKHHKHKDRCSLSAQRPVSDSTAGRAPTEVCEEVEEFRFKVTLFGGACGSAGN
ncbi:MAG: hypothetical protein GDA37_05385, partial [Ekhidna sp.]|nr:hypothetical protein [Ekhidna sp.]